VGLGAALGRLGEGAMGAGGCEDDGGELGWDTGPRADITGEGEEDCVGGCVGPGRGLLLDDVAPVGDDGCDEGAAAFDGEELDEAADEALVALSVNASDDVVGDGPSIGCDAAPASVWCEGVVPGTRIRPIPTATRLTPLTVAWRWVRNFTSPLGSYCHTRTVTPALCSDSSATLRSPFGRSPVKPVPQHSSSVTERRLTAGFGKEISREI
jgi:hypothetical protein